ncbi:MAG: nickel-binding protein [Rubrobacter sp.]
MPSPSTTAHGTAEEGKLYCEYEAPSVELVYEHARLADLPVDKCAVVRELEPSMFR